MTQQPYDENTVYSDSPVFVWTVCKVQIIMLNTVEALSPERVPDLVLGYVFTHNAGEDIS
jgi:hypothetical protein